MIKNAGFFDSYYRTMFASNIWRAIYSSDFERDVPFDNVNRKRYRSHVHVLITVVMREETGNFAGTHTKYYKCLVPPRLYERRTREGSFARREIRRAAGSSVKVDNERVIENRDSGSC